MCRNSYNGKFSIFRGATNLGNATEGISSSNFGQISSFDNLYAPVTIQYYDSPSSTSSLTYQLYIKNNGGSQTMELNNSSLSSGVHIGTFTVMEIKG